MVGSGGQGGIRVLHGLALILTALTLVPLGAHLFALPNKIGLPAEAYLVAQGLYRGWWMFGLVQVPAMLVALLLAEALRRAEKPFWLALAAGLLLALTLAIFFTFTQPANVATGQWTSLPANWQVLRLRWEWSHAASAVLAFGALCCLVLSVPFPEPRGRLRP